MGMSSRSVKEAYEVMKELGVETREIIREQVGIKINAGLQKLSQLKKILTKSEYKKCEKMTKEEFSEYVKLNATKTQITDFDVDYDIDIEDLELETHAQFHKQCCQSLKL